MMKQSEFLANLELAQRAEIKRLEAYDDDLARRLRQNARADTLVLWACAFASLALVLILGGYLDNFGG